MFNKRRPSGIPLARRDGERLQQAPKKNSAPPHQKANESKIHGRNAAIALFKFRKQDIIRLYVHEEKKEDFKEILDWCAKNKKSYHLVGDQDLEKLCQGTHHQGICILAKDKANLTIRDLQKELPFHHEPCLLVYLDGVSNPHNLGAILRNCAHFGVKFVLGERDKLPDLSPAAHRISEGAAEHIHLVKIDNLSGAFEDLKKLGFSLVVADMENSTQSLDSFTFPKRSILVLGAEVAGVSEEMSARGDHIVHIRGTGVMESMNVSAVSAVFFHEYYRQTIKK